MATYVTLDVKKINENLQLFEELLIGRRNNDDKCALENILWDNPSRMGHYEPDIDYFKDCMVSIKFFNREKSNTRDVIIIVFSEEDIPFDEMPYNYVTMMGVLLYDLHRTGKITSWEDLKV